MTKPALLALAALVIGAGSAFAQTGTGPTGPTGRTEESTRITGTAGSRAEVLAAPEFVRQAAISSNFEVESGRLAAERLPQGPLHSFAQEMVEVHGRIMDELRGMLQQNAALRGDKMPQGLDQRYQQRLDNLKNASAGDLHSLYVLQQREVLLIAVDMFRNYAEAGDNDQLKQWASATLPKLKQQLEKVQSISPSTG